MSNNFDDYAFQKRIAKYQIGFGIFIGLGVILVTAGITFLATGAIEVIHASDTKSDYYKMSTPGFKFVESGAWDLVIGLLITMGSGIAFVEFIHKIPSPTQSRIERLENIQYPSQPDLIKINQYEEEIQNVKIQLDIANLKTELTNLKLEVAERKFQGVKNKTNIKNNRKRRIKKINR